MQDYLTELRALRDVVKAIEGPQDVGVSGESFVLIDEMFQIQHGTLPFEKQQGMERHRNACVKHNDDMILAIISLRGSLPTKHKTLKAEFQNQHNLGSNLYPINLTHIMKVLQKQEPKKRCSQGEKETTELVFTSLGRRKQKTQIENCT